MIRAQKLPEILGSVLHDGILGGVLMTTEGSVISSLFTEQSTLDETVLAAVASSIWLNYVQGGGADVDTFIEKLEDGIVGISSTQRGYIIALYGNEDAAIGMLRGRLEAVCSYFTRVFDKLK